MTTTRPTALDALTTQPASTSSIHRGGAAVPTRSARRAPASPAPGGGRRG